MPDFVWWVIAGLALLCAWLLRNALRLKRQNDAEGRRMERAEAAAGEGSTASDGVDLTLAATPAASIAAPTSLPPAAQPSSVVASAAPHAPESTPSLPASPPAARPPRAPLGASAAAPVVSMPAPPAPAPAGQEHPVLTLERAPDELWDRAVLLQTSTNELATLSTLAARTTVKTDNIYVARFRDHSPLKVARGEIPAHPSTRATAQTRSSSPWLNAAASASFAGTALGAWIGERYLAGLQEQSSEVKAALAAVPLRLATPADPRLKSFGLELARMSRETRENYAAAIAKPLFIRHVADTAAQAATSWHAVQPALTAVRAQLVALAQAPRFGEAQLEKSLTLLRELQGQRRVQDAALRIVAGFERLRLALADEGKPPGGLAMRTVCEASSAGLAQDTLLIARLRACEEAAQGSSDYVGKGEFATNRATLQALLAKLESEPSALAVAGLSEVADARDAGFLDGQISQWALLFRVDEQGLISELRHLR